MKHILLFICLFTFIATTAQSKDVSDNTKGLTETEVKLAAKKYEEMTHTQTYISLKKVSKIVYKKLNGNILSAEQIAEWYYNKALMRKWVSENIKKTEFTSFEEGTELLSEKLNLFEKKRLENKDLYKLIKRASLEQMNVIMAAEHKTHTLY